MKQLDKKPPVGKFGYQGKQLVLSWNKVEGADSYEIQILFYPSKTSTKPTISNDKTAETQINIDNPMSDMFPRVSAQVRAVAKGEEGPWSEPVELETEAPPAPTTDQPAPATDRLQWIKNNWRKITKILLLLILVVALVALALWLCWGEKKPATHLAVTDTSETAAQPPLTPPAASADSVPKEKKPRAQIDRLERPPVVINKYTTIISNSVGSAIAINNGSGQVMANVYSGQNGEASEEVITRTNEIPVGMNNPNPSDVIGPGENVLYYFPPGWTIRPISDPYGCFDIRPLHSRNYDGQRHLYQECGGIMVHAHPGYNGTGRLWFHPTAERRGR